MLGSKTITAAENANSNTSITFRIDTYDLEQLKAFAGDIQISLNTLVNQVLKSYLEWDRTAAKGGNVIMQRHILKAIFDFMPENELEKIALEAANNSKDELYVMTGNADLEAIMTITKRRAKKSGFVLREFTDAEGINVDDDNEKTTLVIQQDMGRKWSVFFKAYNERLVNNAGYAAKIEATDNLITIKVPK